MKYLNFMFVGVNFGWVVKYSIIGYQYTIKFSKKRRYLKINLGFRYRIFIILPCSISVFGERRKLALLGTNYIELIKVSRYIRYLRNLLPYKLKGLIFVDENVKLKQGKKVKYR